jgi:AcrR family transcriptional regulator
MLERTAQRKVSARDRLLDEAESSVLRKGFGATSIEELVAATGLSKSGFFYHFKDKNELAKALLARYIETDRRLLDELFARADALNDDPLHGFLVFLKFLAETLEELPDVHPGCMVASICYQEQLFSHDVREMNKEALLAWRRRFHIRLLEIAMRYPPRVEVDLQDLADMAAALTDGGITLSRTLRDAAILPKQVMLYRAFIRALFAPG